MAARELGDTSPYTPTQPAELAGSRIADSAASELPAPAESPARSLSPDHFVDPTEMIRPLRQPRNLAAQQSAQEAANTCEQFLALMATGIHSQATAAKMCGRAPSYFSGRNSMLARYLAGGTAALVPGTGGRVQGGDLTQQIEALPWFVPAARFFNLLSNRTFNSGSVPEAIRRTLSLPALPFGWKASETARFLKAIGLASPPVCPPEIREACLARERAGQDLVPPRVHRQIVIRAALVRQHRNPKEAALDLLNSPGGMRLFTDLETGELRLAKAGEIIEGDDATINFPVCVPWNRDGSDDPCVSKYGVRVARFQWLVTIDVGTGYVTGYSYTCRPRSSYRAEDIVSLLRTVVLQHGIPALWRFERGAWESKLVTNAIRLMGSHLDTVYSPHQKPFIEGLFNVLWTKLSIHFPGADVGRFRGETAQANEILVACQRGHRDPRKHFPMLATVLQVFDDVIREKNRTPINTTSHGRWIPEERFAREINRPRLDPESQWMFYPWVTEWKVRGMLVGGRVPIFEELSVPFDFSAPWLTNFDGAKVKCHFDPAAPKCQAMITLREAYNGKPAGSILGLASQIGTAAAYTRMVMGWGEDPATAGPKARQAAAGALRREVRGIVGRPGQDRIRHIEERDGLGTVTRMESGSESPHGVPPSGGPLPEETPDRQNAELPTFERPAPREVSPLEFV